MKKKKVFIRYRNTIVDGKPENWNLVHQLKAELKSGVNFKPVYRDM